jgi:hypothetical protein
MSNHCTINVLIYHIALIVRSESGLVSGPPGLDHCINWSGLVPRDQSPKVTGPTYTGLGAVSTPRT